MLTTHLMDEADRCDRLAILSQGKLMAVDTPANLKARIGGDVVAITPKVAHAEELADLAQQIDERFAPWPPGGQPRVVSARGRTFRHSRLRC